MGAKAAIIKTIPRRVLAALALCTGLGLLPAGAATVTKTAQLVCGQAVISSRTTCETHVPPDDGFGWLSQNSVYCARDDAGGICAGQQEWMRVMSLSGNRPDAGYAPQDFRYMALFGRLGLNVDGLQMQDATGQ